MLEVASGERDRELLAAVAGEQIGVAEDRTPGAGRLAQNPVARLVAVAVVVFLEEVEVEHRDRQR